MARPTSRQEFKDYILRKIGAPVIQINVADEQIEDRIDEAIEFFTDFHYNGSERVYVKHLLTAEDVERGYVDIPENIIGVSRIWNIGSSVSMGGGMWNVQYQYVLNNMSELTSGSISNHWISMQTINFVQEWMVGVPIVRYNRHNRRLYIDDKDAKEGMWVVIEGHAYLDGNEFESLWSDRWLQNYATALVTEQWGNHLVKYSNMQLVGGIQFNGDQILARATEDRRRMEEEAIGSLQPLAIGFIA